MAKWTWCCRWRGRRALRVGAVIRVGDNRRPFTIRSIVGFWNDTYLVRGDAGRVVRIRRAGPAPGRMMTQPVTQRARIVYLRRSVRRAEAA